MVDGVLEQVKKFYALAFHQKYGARTISILDGILNGSLSATSITDIPKLVYMVGAHTNSSD